MAFFRDTVSTVSATDSLDLLLAVALLFRKRKGDVPVSEGEMNATVADTNSECVRVVEVDLGRKLTATELAYVDPLCSQGHPPSAIAQGLESEFIKALRVDFPDLDPDELKLAKRQFRKGMRIKRVKELIEEGRLTYGS